MNAVVEHKQGSVPEIVHLSDIEIDPFRQAHYPQGYRSQYNDRRNPEFPPHQIYLYDQSYRCKCRNKDCEFLIILLAHGYPFLTVK